MAEIPVQHVTAAARALMLAGAWDAASGLLAAVTGGQPGEAAALALARAQAAVEVRQWRGTGDPAPALSAAADLIAGSGDEALALDLELLRLFADYWAELMPAGGRAPWFGPENRDPAVLSELAERAGRLASRATGPGRAARAAFYGGIIADNLRGEPQRAEELFAQALAAAEEAGDDAIASEALRHLGGCAQARGDLQQARAHWERSAGLAARAGWVPLTLAQQALLAELAAEEGDPARAAALAAEVQRWAHALGLGRLAAQAAAVTP